ncbi:hypothetical protein ABZY44_33260 [Streptomyces sp. NPDC006544]
MPEQGEAAPGFRSETHGVTVDPGAGDCPIECVRQDREAHLRG